MIKLKETYKELTSFNPRIAMLTLKKIIRLAIIMLVVFLVLKEAAVNIYNDWLL